MYMPCFKPYLFQLSELVQSVLHPCRVKYTAIIATYQNHVLLYGHSSVRTLVLLYMSCLHKILLHIQYFHIAMSLSAALLRILSAAAFQLPPYHLHCDSTLGALLAPYQAVAQSYSCLAPDCDFAHCLLATSVPT